MPVYFVLGWWSSPWGLARSYIFPFWSWPQEWLTSQDALELTDKQIDNLLTCYQWMLDGLQRCAEERNEDILPQLGLEAIALPKVILRLKFSQALPEHANPLFARQYYVLAFLLLTPVQQASITQDIFLHHHGILLRNRVCIIRGV